MEESRDRFQSHDSIDSNNNNNNDYNNNNNNIDENNNTDNNNNNNNNNNTIPATKVQRHKRSSSVTSNSSIESLATSRSRKTSVVQIKSRDETSDYHSDEDVFDGGECAGGDEFRATICYVGSCAIKKTSRISVSDGVSELKDHHDNNHSKRGRSKSLKEQIVYKDLVFSHKVMDCFLSYCFPGEFYFSRIE